MVLSLPRIGERPMMTEASADLTCWLASDTSSWEGEGRREPQGQRLQRLHSYEAPRHCLLVSSRSTLSARGELERLTCSACLEFNAPCPQEPLPQTRSSVDEETL